MQKEMPKKYWRNLPETELISELVHAAPHRVEAMIKAEHQLPRKRLSAKPRSLADPDDDIVAHDPAKATEPASGRGLV